MIRPLILFLLLLGTVTADEIRIDWRNTDTGNFAPINLTTTPEYVITFDANGNPIIGPAAAGVEDGNKGDITVSGSGSIWTIDVPYQPLDSDLTYLAGFTPTLNVKSLLNAADYAAIRTQLSLVPGTNVQAYDADLAIIAAHTTAALGATTALVANTTYTGAITTRTVTLSTASSFTGQVIRFSGTAAASTVITWPASAVRQVGGTGYSVSTTFAIGNAEFSLWSDGTDWYLVDSTGAGGGSSLPASGALGSTLKSDGSAAFWSDLSNTIEFKEEFFYGSPSAIAEHWTIAGTASFGLIGAATANHWGILRLRSTGADQTLITAGSTPDHIVLGSGVAMVEWIIKTTETAVAGTGALSDATDNYTLVVGLGDTPLTAATQTDGVYFRYNHAVNSGKWERVTESNTSEEALDTGVAFAGATWIRLGMLITNATSVQFFINGTSVGTNSTGANIPNGTARVLGVLYAFDRTAGTAERNMFVDAFHLVFKPTTPR